MNTLNFRLLFVNVFDQIEISKSFRDTMTLGLHKHGSCSAVSARALRARLAWFGFLVSARWCIFRVNGIRSLHNLSLVARRALMNLVDENLSSRALAIRVSSCRCLRVVGKLLQQSLVVSVMRT